MQITNQRDMDLKQEVLEEIKKWDTIIIHRHQRPDPDALGSQAGLGELIKYNFPEKTVKYAGEIPAGLHFLLEPEQVTEEDYAEALVITTDTANVARIDGEFYSKTDKWIKIDHHPKDDSYGDIEWVNTDASSCSEMITDFWLSFEELSLPKHAAKLLYAGIVGDTGRFQFDNTSPTTMQLAAELMKFDFDHASLNSKFGQLTEKEINLLGYAFSNIQTLEEGVGYLILSQKIMDEMGVNDQETGSVVGVPGRLENIFAWVIFVEQYDGTYRCRIRSKGPIINGVAKEHDGGGHPKASGANARDLQEMKVILEKLTKVTLEWKKNLSV